MRTTISRRELLAGSGALALTTYASPIRAAAPEPSTITPALIEAAKKEGKVVFYTSIEVQVGEKIAKAFEAKYPGIDVQVERSGSERIFQRIGQEYTSKIYNADVVSTSDAAHFIIWKREGWLMPYVPEDVATHFPKEQQEPDGTYLAWCRESEFGARERGDQ